MTQHVLPTDEDDESSMEKKDYLFEKQFDHGILIIDNQDKPINTHILEAKKQHYSALCRKNEEIERIEQELLQTDPARATQIKQQLVHVRQYHTQK